MRISLNKIKELVKIPADVTDEDLITLIGSRLVEIEEVINLGPAFDNIYIVKIVKCEHIEGTHLNLCEIDDAGVNQNVKRLENGLVQVVCGAPNAHAGMLAVWIAPGAIVPSTYGEENFKIGARKMQGYESNGMLSGADELGFDNEHKSIAEIDPKMAAPGDLLKDIFDLDDKILDVENKSLTHRPDCFGLIGFAREVAGILGVEFVEPELAELHAKDGLGLQVEIKDAGLCPRYTCAVFELGSNEPSKYLTKEAIFLAKSGMRAIDPVVDLTNILMLETGQPLHAFDYDKLVQVGGKAAAKIIVRSAKEGEELQLLDGKTIQCIPEDILITSNNIPVALAGAMGGKNTECDASTKRVVLESATFSLYNLRKTQMAHGIFSEAITRFTKGQPAAMCGFVLAEAVKGLGVETEAVVDEFPSQQQQIVVKITTSEINDLLGSDYDVELIKKTLENVGFGVEMGDRVCHGSQCSLESSGGSAEAKRRDPATAGVANVGSKEHVSHSEMWLVISVPFWRTDIHIKEDIIEEVGRLLGYDNIPQVLPEKRMIEAEIAPMFSLKRELRGILSDRLEMHELLTYSFVSSDLIKKVNQDPEDCYEIVNSISPDLQRFRSEIAPSLLDKVRENIKAGHRDFTLYEMNQVSRKSYGLTNEKTPVLKNHLGVVAVGDFYSLKAKILAMFKELGISVTYAGLSKEKSADQPELEPKRSAELVVDGQVIGAFGEVKLSVLRKFKLETVITAAEINLDKILSAPRDLDRDFRISRFPSVERDLTATVASDAPFGRFLQTIEDALKAQDLSYSVEPVSIYQAKPTDSTKNISFRLKFANFEKTLDATEISAIMDAVTVEVVKIGAVIK